MVSLVMRSQSEAVFNDLLGLIPGGVNSPVRSFKGLLETPLVAERGFQDLVYDVDGNSYIDYCMSWGTLIHGHAHPEIVKSAVDQIRKGSSFGLTTPYEAHLAKKIRDLVPSVEKVRFVSSGTEATMSALRLARGYTKRKLIVKFSGNYHGHVDLLLVKAGSGVYDLNRESTSLGVPLDAIGMTVSLPYNDEIAFKALMDSRGDEVAAVIIEPIAGNMGVVLSHLSFLSLVRKLTSEKGALLIFDEVMTGFRVAKGGAQSLYKIRPDLTCFSKILGGGFPVGAFGGREEIMNILAPLGEVYQAGTLSGNPIAMRAGLKALELLDSPGFYEELDRKTRIITDPIEAFIYKKGLKVALQKAGSMFTLFFGVTKVETFADLEFLDKGKFKQFFIYLFERGILASPSQQEAWFVSNAHTEEHLETTRDICLEFLERFC